MCVHLDMTLDEIVAWYQKKIGTYDKQQWEKTVEQKILNGFIHVPLKNTKLKTELIDVDLVRGSSFTKAKPKQSLLTVLKLSVLRLLFLPVYSKWWISQTTFKIFLFLLFIYLIQCLNCIIYLTIQKQQQTIITVSELLIPISLSMILSVIHSQIVATSSTITSEEKRKNRKLKQPRKSLGNRSWDRDRVRVRKKNTRIRSGGGGGASGSGGGGSGSQSNLYDIRKKQQTSSPSPPPQTQTTVSSIDCCITGNIELFTNSNSSEINLRKRNVNWDSPIKSQVVLSNFDHHVYPIDDLNNEKQINEIIYEYLDELIAKIDDYEMVLPQPPLTPQCDDDGFESLNGKSSSGEENNQIERQHQQERSNNETNKIPYRNTWIRDILENGVAAGGGGGGRMTDSDTDTLKGNSSAMVNLFTEPFKCLQ